jgi:large subunit ribosomal protein L4
MKAKLYTQQGAEKGELDLPAEVFESEINEHLMHEAVTAYLANQRQGTAETRGRSEVSGGGKKPWRQKGTGRARAGSNTSPLWVRGGKAFGAHPRSYTVRMPRKMRRGALCSALSSRARDEKVFVIEEIALAQPKTREIAGILSAMAVTDKKNLLIIDSANTVAYLSGRNIKNLQIKAVSDVNTYDVLRNENVIFGAESLIEKMKEVVAL